MDPDAALNEARHALNYHDLTTARDHLMDISNWIDIGGYVPAYFYEVLDQYNDLERTLSADL